MNWPDDARFYPSVMFGSFYGVGTILWPIILACQGRLSQLFTLPSIIIWTFGLLLATILCAFAAIAVFKARRGNDGM
jgi:hypothetical protein